MTVPLVPFPELLTASSASAWYDAMRGAAATLGLTTTAWQQGGMVRTEFSVFANVLMLQDVNRALLIQAGFLDYAATGTVSYIDLEGNLITVPVTPDPSNPAQNPTGELGALDVLAFGVYNVLRPLATFAGGELALLNTSSTTYGPFAATTYHVAQPLATGAPSYSNTASLTIPPSAVVATIADVVSAGGLIEIETSGAHGLVDDDVIMIAGVGGVTPLADPTAWIVTVVDGTHFTLNSSVFAGSYTSGGTVYTPTIASFTADVKGTGSNATSGNRVTESVTSLIGVSVANVEAWLGSDTESNVALAARCRLKLQSLSPNGPRGAYEYFAKSAQELAPGLTPPLAVSSAITRALVQTDATTGTVTTTIANSTGAPSGDDVLAVEAVHYAYCVPNAVTAIVQAAAEEGISVDVKIWVPAAFIVPANAVGILAIQTFFAVLPIGGVTDPEDVSPSTNVVPRNALMGSIYCALTEAAIPVQQVHVTLDGGVLNIQLDLTPVPEVATISSLTGDVIPV